MPMYDSDSFDPSILPAQFKKETVEYITVASALGWKVHLTSNRSVTIISPSGKVKYHFGLSNRATKNRHKLRRDLVKYADPERLAAAVTGSQLLDAGYQQLAREMAPEVEPVVDSTPESEKHTYADEQEGAQQEGPVTEPVHSVKKEPHIVSQKPMVARAGETTGYDSETTIVRKWSDGSTDYACAYPGCDFTSPHRKGPSGHYAPKHRDKPAPVSGRYRVTVTDHARYRPRRSRVEALAQVIAGLIEEGVTDPHVIAQQALTWVHEQSHHDTEYAAEREEMTPEETLARIRLLLDDGSYSRLHQMVDEQAQQIVALENRAEQAERKAAEAMDTLQAFRELAAELTDGERKEQEAG